MLLRRGGIPILFPQVGAGRLPRGGFMSDLHWSLVDSAIAPGYMDGDTEDPAPSVILHAQDDPWTLSMFPHEFEALYTVCVLPLPPAPPNNACMHQLTSFHKLPALLAGQYHRASPNADLGSVASPQGK